MAIMFLEDEENEYISKIVAKIKQFNATKAE